MTRPVTPDICPRCLICHAPAEVSWPVRNSPHCRKCVKTAREFVAESEARIPKFGELEDKLAGVVGLGYIG